MNELNNLIKKIDDKLIELSDDNPKLQRLLRNSDNEVLFQSELRKKIREVYDLKIKTSEITKEEIDKFQKLTEDEKEKEFKDDLKYIHDFCLKEIDYKISLFEEYLIKLRDDREYEIFKNQKESQMTREEYMDFTKDFNTTYKVVNEWHKEYKNLKNTNE